MKRSTAELSTVPTIVFYALFVVLHIVCVNDRQVLANFHYADSTIFVVSAAGLLCLLAQLFLARRRATASWKIALPPGILVLLGCWFVWMQLDYVRWVMEDEIVDPTQLLRIFSEGMGEALNHSILACMLAALALAHAVWLVTLRLKSRHAIARHSPQAIVTAVGIGVAILVMLIWRMRRPMSLQQGGLLSPMFTVVAGAGLVVGALVVLDLASQAERQRKTWADFLIASICAVGSVAFAAVAGHAHAISRGYDSIGGESVDADQKQRILVAAWQTASTEITLGLMGGALLGVAGFLVLLTRRDAACRSARTGLLPLLCALVATVWLPWAYTTRLMREQPEYRTGAINEFIVAKSIGPGTVIVELVPFAGGTDLGMTAEIKLSIGRTASTNANQKAEFTKIPAGVPFTVKVETPYLAEPAGPFILGARQGGRVRIGVLRLAPQFGEQQSELRVEPEKVLHVDMTDPGRYRLTWAQSRIVVSTEELPPDIWALTSKVAGTWQMFGSHKNDGDSHQDIAIIHYIEPGSLDELKRVAESVARQERNFKGERIPAFKIYLHPMQPAEASIDDEVEPSRFASLRPADAIFQIKDALVRCQGRPCHSGQASDVWGLELGRACNVPVCGVGTVAGLWLRLGDALAERGESADAAEAFTHAGLLNPKLVFDTESGTVALAAFRANGGLALPVVRQGALTVNGRLDPKTIAAVVGGRMGFFRRCYAEGLHNNPNLQGRVSMRFVIGRDGVASEPGNGGSDLPDASVVQCIVKAAAGLTFPPPEGGIVTVVAPFMFAPR